MDIKAFYSISYGLYLISSQSEGAASGCVVNTFAQVTAEPFQVSVTMNKENRTTEVIQESGFYTAVVLAEDATMDLIGKFGFYCSRDVNKFEPFLIERDDKGIPHVKEQVVARFAVRVTQEVDLGTHLMFIGTVEDAEVLSEDTPMTYAHYHKVKGGKTPPRAASFVPGLDDVSASETDEPQKSPQGDTAKPKFAWRCTLCGHIENVEELPDDFTCPICGAGKELFERIEV